jgi:outer membrane protease
VFFVSILYVFLAAAPLVAETEAPVPRQFPYTFSVGASTGFLYGQGEEIVYKYENSDVYLSQLLWDLKPLFYVGSALSFSRRDPGEKLGFFGELLVKFGIPRQTGSMEDRDWMSIVNNNDLTHFSSHDNYTKGVLLIDFSTGISLPLPFKTGPFLKSFIGLSYMRFKWTAQDGYYQYAERTGTGIYEPWDESIEKTMVYGPAIAYSQEWLIFTLLGYSLDIPLFDFFTLSFSFQMGPVIFCKARDDHLIKGVQYNDYVSGGIMLEPRGEVVFSPHQRVLLSLYCGYRRIRGSRGESLEIWQSGAEARSEFDSAGAGYAALDTGLSLKVQF